MYQHIPALFKKYRHHGINALWLNADQFIISAFGLALSVIFARFAGKELYGQYLFAIALVGFLSILSIPGTKTVIFRCIAQGYDSVYKKASTLSIKFSMIGIPILITTGLYYLHFGNVLLGSALICISPFFPALSPLEAWKHFFKGKSLFNYYAALNSLLVVIRFGLVVAFLFITKHIVFILLAHFAAQSLLHISFHTYALHIARKGKQKIEPDWKKQSFALSILSFSQTIFGTMDMVIIGNLLALDQVAIYGIVMKLVDLFIKFFRNFSQSLAPTLFKKTHVNIKKFIGAALLLFTAPTILFFTIKPLIIFVYSEQYIACIPLLQTYVWIIPIAVSAKFCNIFLVKHKLNLEINITRITSIILVILCYFTLIPLLGIWGGIVGSMVYYTSELVLTLYFLKRKKLF